MKKIMIIVFLSLIIIISVKAQSNLHLVFIPLDTSFSTAAKDYENIWKEEGRKILETMEQMSGLKFIDSVVEVIVYEDVSNSGDNVKSPMKLRASYSYATKKATLIHELGHRLNFAIKSYPSNYNDHNILFLYLYDVWVNLYGQKFADEQVQIEGNRSNPGNDYKTMWQSALSMGQVNRRNKLKDFLSKYN